MTLTVLGIGSFFGEQSLVGSAVGRTASAVALSGSETAIVDERLFTSLRAVPGFDDLLLEGLSAQVQRLSAQLVDAVSRTADERGLQCLRWLVGALGRENETCVIPLTQTDLASLAGVSRQTMNQICRSLERDGIVSLGRARLTVHEPEAL